MSLISDLCRERGGGSEAEPALGTWHKARTRASERERERTRELVRERKGESDRDRERERKRKGRHVRVEGFF